MTYDDFLAALGKAGLSVRAFADLIGMNPNSVSNYASSDEVPRHLAVIAVLLGEMNVNGVAFRAAIERINFTRKKPRGRGRPGRFGGDKQDQLELESVDMKKSIDVVVRESISKAEQCQKLTNK